MMIVVCIVLFILAIMDITTRTIRNEITYFLIVLSAVYGVVSIGALNSAKGLIISFALGILLMSLGALGGADVKLFMAIGSGFGALVSFRILCYSIMLQGFTGVFIILKAKAIDGKPFSEIKTMSGAFIPYMFSASVLCLFIR